MEDGIKGANPSIKEAATKLQTPVGPGYKCRESATAGRPLSCPLYLEAESIYGSPSPVPKILKCESVGWRRRQGLFSPLQEGTSL